MSIRSDASACGYTEQVPLYALALLPAGEVAEVEAHIHGCLDCQRELASCKPVLDSLAEWPTDILRPAPSLWGRLARRVTSDEATLQSLAAAPPPELPEWANAAPGISCKVLAIDEERKRLTMLVRLAPGAAYPPHTHAGTEELHLLDGELWIEDRKLLPGDYNRAEAGTADKRVWSETGCTCVLITSAEDSLG
jgi:quercetin dioxygenase-like cupin family protein